MTTSHLALAIAAMFALGDLTLNLAAENRNPADTPTRTLLIAVALTIVTEGVTWWIVVRPRWLDAARLSRRALLPAVVAINLLTVPIANVAFGALADQGINEWLAFGLIECAVMAVETVVIRLAVSFTLGRAAILSAAANGVSLTTGLLIFW